MVPDMDPERVRRLKASIKYRLGALLGVVKRAYVRARYRGLGYVVKRVFVAVVRRTPFQRLVAERARQVDDVSAMAWYAHNSRPVTVVIPTFGAAELTAATVKSIRDTSDASKVRVVVCDDAGPADQRDALQAIEGIDELVLADENAGFAANVNRGMRLADGDVVILNNDVIAHPGWLEALQYAAYSDERHGIVGPMLLYPDGRIQSGGTIRNPGAPEWFDHRFRFQPASHGPANIPAPALAMTGACLYVKRAVIDEIGMLDEGFPMAFEDVDYCIRAWNAGFHVRYYPNARLTHHESVTRGTEVNEREQRSMDYFWEKWGDWFDARNVRTPDGKLRIIYVTEDTGVGGGHRDIFEHLNRLQDRGHEVALYTLREEPAWFPLEAPVHTFSSYEELTDALAEVEAIKIATWWNTAEKVWTASVAKGIPLYFIQDIETSYYDGNEAAQQHVLASYRPDINAMTISSHSLRQLADLGLEAALIPPGIDLDNFRPLGIERKRDMILALGRSNPLKNLPLTIKAWKRLAEPRPELWLFGVEPRIGVRYGARYITSPSDSEVNELFNQAGVFVQTSRHEGFCLPALEAMATGAPVVCTDMNGNRDFCEHEVNCLMVDHNPASVAAGIERLRRDDELRSRLAKGGIETAARYSWDLRIDELERFYESLAAPGPMSRGASDGGSDAGSVTSGATVS
jgi:GT2 family glycosyltransferase